MKLVPGEFIAAAPVFHDLHQGVRTVSLQMICVEVCGLIAFRREIAVVDFQKMFGVRARFEIKGMTLLKRETGKCSHLHDAGLI